MPDLLNFKTPCDLTGFTLIIPSVSVGNVGQLTVDLIIATYNLKKVATLWHPGLIPLVGSDPFDLGVNEPCTACELYVNEALKLAVLQLRTSVEMKLASNFLTMLKEKIVELRFENIVILTSTFAYELRTVDASHFRNIGCDAEVAAGLQIQTMEVEEYGAQISGTGFAVKLYELLKDSVPTVVFMKYVSEGDNRPDAISMLDLLARFRSNLNNKAEYNLKFPVSWNYVFGNPPPIGIY